MRLIRICYLRYYNYVILDSKVIFREIQHKNHFVFKRLFEDFYPELVVYANEYLFDVGFSEDIVQEIFVQLWEKSNTIHIRTSLRAYMYTMVRNRCLNFLKTVRITDTSKILETQAVFDIDNPQGFREDDNRILYEEVLKTIEKLPRKMRTIVKLRFMDNYRYKEIADELGVSVNTVKTQLKRAKIKFGELIISLASTVSILI